MVSEKEGDNDVTVVGTVLERESVRCLLTGLAAPPE